MTVKLEAIVDSVEVLSPSWRRVRLRNADFAEFSAFEGIHLKIEVRPTGNNVEPVSRVYTVASTDVTGSLIDVDIFLHGDGPGSMWATNVRSGDIVQVNGPVGRRPVALANWYLLVTDEAGIPALRRIFDHIGEDATGKAFALVDGPAERPPLSAPRGMQLDWVYRQGNVHASLIDSVCDARLPADPSIFCWCATEALTVKAIGRHWKSIGIQPTRISCGAYWRRTSARSASP